MKKNTIVLIALLVCNSLMAGRVKTIIVADTRSNLRCGIQNNVAYTCTSLEMIAAQLDMVNDFDPPIVLDEFRCNRDELRRELTKFTCTSEDVVLFFYFGHGARSKDDRSRYPQMQLRDEKGNFTSDTHVPLEEIKEILIQKGARFVLVFGDCCNSEHKQLRPKTTSLLAASTGSSEISDSPQKKQMLHKLFIEITGSIITTGSQVGTPSYYFGPERNDSRCASHHCGFYTDVFWNVLWDNKGADLNWENWLRAASRQTNSRAKESSKDSISQIPIYTVEIEPSVPTTLPTLPVEQNENKEHPRRDSYAQPRREDKKLVDDSATALQSLLVAIASDRNSYEQRENMSKKVLKEFFAPRARVEVIAQNGRTIVESETAADFLERISLAERLRNVSIRQQEVDSKGKTTYLLVHEVYEKKQ